MLDLNYPELKTDPSLFFALEMRRMLLMKPSSGSTKLSPKVSKASTGLGWLSLNFGTLFGDLNFNLDQRSFCSSLLKIKILWHLSELVVFSSSTNLWSWNIFLKKIISFVKGFVDSFKSLSEQFLSWKSLLQFYDVSFFP